MANIVNQSSKENYGKQTSITSITEASVLPQDQNSHYFDVPFSQVDYLPFASSQQTHCSQSFHPIPEK